MTPEQLSDHFHDLTIEEARLRLTKGIEYAGNNDPLANFKLAENIGIPSTHACWIYLSKSIKSIEHYLANSTCTEGIQSRISDARNYLGFLSAIIAEQEEQAQLSTTFEYGDLPCT